MTTDDLLDDDFDELDDAFASMDEGESHQEKIRAFDEQVERNIKILLSKKPSEEKRVAAAYWLGESGAPKAIYALRKVYRAEKNRRIKAAATYALGQFKALDNAIVRDKGESVSDALQSEENAEIMQLLTAITIEGRVGKRKKLSPRTLVRIEAGLAVLLVILVGLIALTSDNSGGDPTPRERPQLAFEPDEETAISTIDNLQSSAAMIRAAAASLQMQYDSETAAPDCAQTVSLPAPAAVPPEVDANYPRISLLSNRLNQQVSTFQPAVDLHNQICADARPPAPDEINQITNASNAVLAELESITAAVTAEDDSIIATAVFRAENPPTALPTEPGPTATETAAPTPTETATDTPTPTISPQLINRDIAGISFVVDQVNGRMGAYTLLNTFWTDVQSAGRTDGCRERAPEIPEDYPPISEELLEIVPDLGQAREQVNIGLGLLRQGWLLFSESCNNDTLAQNLQTGLTIVTTANSAFTNANSLLNSLRQ